MQEKFPSEQYMLFNSPNENSPECAEWVNHILDGSPSLLAFNRRKIALFDNFPPERVDYYKALQKEIARRVPSEQERPFICLNIRGRQRQQDTLPADIGMAGGIGPDANALENLVCHMSGVEAFQLENAREDVAREMEHFSGVMYSLPPFRDIQHAFIDFSAYRQLYRSAREHLPCTSLHILSNTGHSHKWVFDSQLFFGKKELGYVEDMTVKVADKIQRESNPDENVLILGTIAADKDALYPKLLATRGIPYILPTGYFTEQDAKAYLQLIIDQAKAGKVTENMPNEERTCGRALVDFIIHYAQSSGSQSLLFSCTELPMILHTKIPPHFEHTYLNQLQRELPATIQYRFYDSEKIFVEEIAQKSLQLQEHPEMRSTLSLGVPSSEQYNLSVQLNEIKQSIEDHCRHFINKTDEKYLHKRNVLLATMQYIEDGNAFKLKKVIDENPRFVEAFMLWGSTTLALVADSIELVRRQHDVNKARTRSFKENAAQFQETEPPLSPSKGA